MAVATKTLAKKADIDLDDLIKKVVYYCEKQAGIDLYTYQREYAEKIVESVIYNDGEEITALFARQGGKSETVAVVVAGIMVIIPKLAQVPEYAPFLGQYAKGLWVGLFAPSREQAFTTFSRARDRIRSENARLILNDPEVDTSLDKEANPMMLSNGSRLQMHSAAKQSQIESKTYHLIVLEEAQDIDDTKARKSIRPMGAACVRGDSLVPLVDGRVLEIRELVQQKPKVGIVSLNPETLKLEEAKITAFVDSGVQETLRVTLNSGKEVVGTLDHPILIKPRQKPRIPQWCRLADVAVGMQVAVPKEIPYFSGADNKYARLIGMLIGDGPYRDPGMGRFASKDDELWKFMQGFSEFKVDFYKTSITKSKELYREGVLEGISPILKAAGVYGQTGKNKTLPLDINTYSKASICELIGGLVDINGDVLNSEDRRVDITITQRSSLLLKQLQLLLQKLGVQSKLQECDLSRSKSSFGDGMYYRLWVRDKESVENFYKHIRFLVKSKQDRLEKGVSLLKDKKYKIQKNLVHSDIRFERVSKVEKNGAEQVYDLTVDKFHNFIANGIYVHNTNSTILQVGTCNTKKCGFLEAINRNKRRDVQRRGGRPFHYEYDYTVVQKYNIRYREFIKKEKKRLGEDSDEFRLSYGLEWLLERGMFLSPVMRENMYDKGLKHKLASSNPCAVGIDIGKRNNSTVVTVAEIDRENAEFDPVTDEMVPIKRVLNWLEITGDDYESQYYEVTDFLTAYNVICIYVDSTAVGSAMADRLIYHYEGRAEVVPYDFTLGSKSIMWKLLNKEIKNSRFLVPAHAGAKKLRSFRFFEQQFDDLEKEWKGQYLSCQKPKDDKNAKDDYCDSAALACLAAHHELMPVIEDADNPFFK